MSHPDSLARRPIDPAMENSFGSYSEPGTRNNYQVETSPVVRDDDDVTPELRRRRGEGVRNHTFSSVQTREMHVSLCITTLFGVFLIAILGGKCEIVAIFLYQPAFDLAIG